MSTDEREEDYGMDAVSAAAVRTEVATWPEREIAGERKRWSKVLRGTFYMKPPVNRVSHEHLTRSELKRMVGSGSLAGKPLLLDHRREIGPIGRVLKAYQLADGSCYADMVIDCSSPQGRASWSLVKDHTMLGVSLSHNYITGQPEELSLCIQPGRDDCLLVNASYPVKTMSSTSLSANGNSMLETSTADNNGMTMRDLSDALNPSMRQTLSSLMEAGAQSLQNNSSAPAAAPPAAAVTTPAATPAPAPPAPTPDLQSLVSQLTKAVESSQTRPTNSKKKKAPSTEMDVDSAGEEDDTADTKEALIRSQQAEIKRLRTATEITARKAAFRDFMSGIPDGIRKKATFRAKAHALRNTFLQSEPLVSMSKNVVNEVKEGLQEAVAAAKAEDHDNGMDSLDDEPEHELKKKPFSSVAASEPYCSSHHLQRCCKKVCVQERINMGKKKKHGEEQSRERSKRFSKREQDMDEDSGEEEEEEEGESAPSRKRHTHDVERRRKEDIELKRSNENALAQDVLKILRGITATPASSGLPTAPAPVSSTDASPPSQLVNKSLKPRDSFLQNLFDYAAPIARSQVIMGYSKDAGLWTRADPRQLQ